MWGKWENWAEILGHKEKGNLDWKGWSPGDLRKTSRREETFRLILHLDTARNLLELCPMIHTMRKTPHMSSFSR